MCCGPPLHENEVSLVPKSTYVQLGFNSIQCLSSLYIIATQKDLKPRWDDGFIKPNLTNIRSEGVDILILVVCKYIKWEYDTL